MAAPTITYSTAINVALDPISNASYTLNVSTFNTQEYAFQAENSLEAIPRTVSLDAIDFLPSILIQEGGPDFAGLTVVEDA